MKTCPVCHAHSFDDMKTCFSCMHRFDEAEDTLPEVEPADPPQRIEIPLCAQAVPTGEEPQSSSPAETAPLPVLQEGGSFFAQLPAAQSGPMREAQAVYRLVVSVQPVLDESDNGFFDSVVTRVDNLAEAQR